MNYEIKEKEEKEERDLPVESKQSNSLREKRQGFGIALIINSSLDQLVDLAGSSDSGQFSRRA